MKIAVVGTGVSGLVAAFRLHRAGHDLTVFEASNRIGGHVNTVDVTIEGQPLAIDTGFIVHNRRNYPRLCALFDELGVPTQASEMTFSVTCERSGWVWGGGSITALFAQPRRAFDLGFWRMLRNIARFNRAALAIVDDESFDPDCTLRSFLDDHDFGPDLVSRYLIPLGASIWSADPAAFDAMPAKTLFQFLANHGLLQIRGRPEWRTVTGGARTYVDLLTAEFRDRIRLSSPVTGIERRADGVVITTFGSSDAFDHVVIATHSDQALDLLVDPSEEERSILGDIRFQPNIAVLHTDASLLPPARRAWSAWNNVVPAEPTGRVGVTYLMNRLQRLPVDTPVCVTLGREHLVDPSEVVGTFHYEHPIFDVAAVAAQRRRQEICGVNRTDFVGAYWYHGFHEDGVRSADDVCTRLQENLAKA